MRLKEIRESRGLTQDQIASRLCVTRQAVSRWENEKTQPDIQTLTILSEVYGCSIDELVRDNDTYALEKDKKTDQYFNKFIIWVPILGLFYSINYLFKYKDEEEIECRRIVITRIVVSILIAGAFVFSYVSFMKLLS